MGAIATHGGESEIAILARVMAEAQGRIPDDVARFILALDFSERDKARMHELALRNQEDALDPAEKEALMAFGRAGDLLAILKSKARRALRVPPEQGTTP